MPRGRIAALIVVCVLLGWVALQSPQAGADPIPGSTCDQGGYSSHTLKDHTLFGLFAPPVAPFTSGRVALQSGCQLWGDIAYLQVYSPDHQLNVTIEQYLTAYQTVEVNKTVGNLTTTETYTVSYRTDCQWDNQSIFPSPWNVTEFSLSLPTSNSWTQLEISINGSGWELWHNTPYEFIPLQSTFGAQWAFTAEFSVLFVLIALIAAGWGKLIVHRMGDLHSTGKGIAIATAILLILVVGIASSYIVDWQWWFLNLGTAGAYALFLLPEFFLMTFIFVFWFRGKSVLRIKLQDAGEVEGEWKRKIRAFGVRWLERDEQVYWIPPGIKQALFRLFLGVRAYPIYNFRSFSRHPGIAKLEGGLGDEICAIPSDIPSEIVWPHFEFNVREDPEQPGARFKVKTYDTGVTEKIGKWHLVRFDSGHRADPLVGRTAFKDIVDDLAHAREVNEIAKDATELEDQLMDKEAEIETGKARRARQLVRKVLAGLRDARREGGTASREAYSRALQEALDQLSKEGDANPQPDPAGAVTRKDAN